HAPYLEGLIAQRGQELLLTTHPAEVSVPVACSGIFEGPLAVQPLHARLEAHLHVAVVIGRVEGVVDTFRHRYRHAPQRVDGSAEAVEVDDGEMADRDTEVALDGLTQQWQAPTGSLLRLADGVGGVDAILTVAGNVDHEIARDREQGRAF